jgi:transposase
VCLPHCTVTCTEAFLSQNQEAWIAAHVNTYAYFGGVARILVPDNLKTGVIKHTNLKPRTNSPPQLFNLSDAGVQHERPKVFNCSDIFKCRKSAIFFCERVKNCP